MTYVKQDWDAGLDRLKGTVEQQRTALGAVSASDLQAALISIATANSGSPTNGQAIVFQASTGNLIWGTGGGGATYTASADFSDARNSMYLALFEDI